MKRFLICIFYFSLVIPISAQDQIKIDSLQIKLTNLKEDTTKVGLLLELSEIYRKTDLLKALQLAENALEISNQINNDHYKVLSYIKIGNYLIFIGKYDDALNNLLKGLKITQKKHYDGEELFLLNSLGIIQDRLGNFDKALKYYFDALNIYNKSIEEKRPLNKIKSVQSLYNNIGNIYLSKNELTIAEKYYLKGLAISEQTADNIDIGVICNNLGKLEGQRNNFTKAYEYLIKSLEARTKVNDKSGIAKSYYYLSKYYQTINQYDKAIDYAKKALDLGTEINEPLTSQVSLMFLYEINKKLGKSDKALEYHELFKQISDSLINDNKTQEMTRLQLQYDYEKLENEKESKQQKITFTYIILISTLTLGLVILGLLFYLTRNRNKRIQLEKKQLEEDMIGKNKELTTNVIFLLRKNELIDSITARLLKLKKTLKEENLAPLQKIIIDIQSLTDKDAWDEFEVRFQNVHEKFYQNLQKKFPDLTPSEIKLAAFLRLNMTTKDIASITGQSVNSLETARYRLRKKLGITNQEVSLVNFLLNF
jgi:tetratricopeptide (TPR) repeat protein/DNA-binding CsgD family transcriptional regulator